MKEIFPEVETTQLESPALRTNPAIAAVMERKPKGLKCMEKTAAATGSSRSDYGAKQNSRKRELI
jgi:hypothetical protein